MNGHADGMARPMGPEPERPGERHRPPATRWYMSWPSEVRDRIQAWLADNPPPEGWHGDRVSWAYHRMPEDVLPASDGPTGAEDGAPVPFPTAEDVRDAVRVLQGLTGDELRKLYRWADGGMTHPQAKAYRASLVLAAWATPELAGSDLVDGGRTDGSP